jgi:hypothetical protein
MPPILGKFCFGSNQVFRGKNRPASFHFRQLAWSVLRGGNGSDKFAQ